jgi:hypothetical protein
MELEWSFWLVAIVGVLITGISKSGFAGGVGVIAVPLLALQVGPLRAAAIMLPLLIVMDFFSVKAWWGKQRSALLRILMPTAVLGIFCGFLLFDYLNDEVLRIVLGSLSISFAGWGLLKGGKVGRLASPVVGHVCGFISGFTSFVAHAGGPPLNFYMMTQQLQREHFLATAAVFLATINLIKLVPYATLGQLNADNLLIGVALAPVAWIGVKLGLKIQHRINDRLFYRCILVMLAAVGLKLILGSL